MLYSWKFETKYYICVMKVNIENLLTVKNYSEKHRITTSYVYKLIKADKVEAVVIDGVQFIDVVKFPIPNKK